LVSASDFPKQVAKQERLSGSKKEGETMYRRFILPGAILVGVLAIGTVGYWFIGGKQYSFVDTLYMTVITITTVGFAEIVDLAGNPAGRAFTMFIAISGIAAGAYAFTNLTAIIVEGELTQSLE
jgi:voltage-gated potassium channel